jgi:hypothetical protein
MVETQRWQALPTQLERAEFEQFAVSKRCFCGVDDYTWHQVGHCAPPC